MTPPRRSRALLAGLAAVGLYLAGAALSSHLGGPHRGGVLFDGFAPPPPYRWSSPPPPLSSSNRAPEAAEASVPLTARGSDGASVLTPDSQASLFLVRGAVPARSEQRSVGITIDPSAPEAGNLPGGFQVAGNRYLLAARYEPGGEPVTGLSMRSTVVLVYPSPPGGRFEHVLLFSSDGRSWRPLVTSVADPQHQAAADVVELGYFAVGRRELPGGGGIPSAIRIGVFAALLAAAAVVGYLGRRRRRRG